MRARAVSLLCALVAAVTVAPATARADGDPASDVLLGQSVFYPYQPPVSSMLQKQLNAETAAAAKAHFPIKVALIGSKVDLGVITQLFGKPQDYAKFLDQEISYPNPQPLLVVMAAGYGTQGLPSAAERTVASLRPPTAGSNGLAEAAVIAVRKLARAAGHPLAATSGSAGGGSTLYIVIGLVAVAALSAAAVVATRRRAGVRRSSTPTAQRRLRTRGTDR